MTELKVMDQLNHIPSSGQRNYPLVDIVILNYNGSHDTLDLLASLKNLSYPNFQVIVIDNKSTQEERKLLFSALDDYPSWKFIFNDENLGFSRGCNQGIIMAKRNDADYVLLLNNDTDIAPDFLTELVNLSEKHDSITGGLILFHSNKSLIWSYGGNLTWGAVPGHLRYLNKIKEKSDLPVECQTDWIPGCCMLIPTGFFSVIGLLDEDYFAYVEDVDFCLRASKAGMKCYVTSKAMIYHKVGQATGGGYSPRGRKLIAESSVIFQRKHGNVSKRLKFWILFWTGILVASIRESLKGNQKAVKMKTEGYRSGWRKKLNPPVKMPGIEIE
jgi:GT2 family glycosyltransferase